MPEVECQTEMTLKTIEGMERHCAILQILIKNNWTGKPEIEDSIALPFGCRLTKDDTERFLFRSFYALEGMELSVSDFKAIKHEFESGDESSKHPHWQESLRSCALRHYGLPILIISVQDVDRHTEIEFCPLQLHLHQRSLSDLRVADIRQAFWEKQQGKTYHYHGFDYTVLDEGNFHLSWAGVSAEELEMCAAHRQLFGGRYGLKRLTRLLERNPGEELDDREELDAERLTTTPLVCRFPPSDDGISSYHSDDSNDSLQLAQRCIRKIYQVTLRERQQRA